MMQNYLIVLDDFEIINILTNIDELFLGQLNLYLHFKQTIL